MFAVDSHRLDGDYFFGAAAVAGINGAVGALAQQFVLRVFVGCLQLWQRHVIIGLLVFVVVGVVIVVCVPVV